MKLLLNLSLFLFLFLIFESKSIALSDYKIYKICKRDRNPIICKKKLQNKRLNLQKGKFIEIPVVPYKR